MELEEAIRLAAPGVPGQPTPDEWAQVVVARATALLRHVEAVEAAEARVQSRRSFRARVVGVVRRVQRDGGGPPTNLGKVVLAVGTSKFTRAGTENAWVDLASPGARELLDRASSLVDYDAIVEISTVTPDPGDPTKRFRYLTGISPVQAEEVGSGVEWAADPAEARR